MAKSEEKLLERESAPAVEAPSVPVEKVSGQDGERIPLTVQTSKRKDSIDSCAETPEGSEWATGAIIIIWYILNAWWNIDNKEVLTKCGLPWTVATFQLFVGWLFVFCPLWLLGWRRFPRASRGVVLRNLLPQGVCHFLTHIGAMIALQAGAVSFTYTVKAAEPVTTAILSALFLSQFYSWPSVIALIPIVGGVIGASLGAQGVDSLGFSWTSFLGASASNLGSSSRTIYLKLLREEVRRLVKSMFLRLPYTDPEAPASPATQTNSVSGGEAAQAAALALAIPRRSITNEILETMPASEAADIIRSFAPSNVFACVILVASLLTFPAAVFFEGARALDFFRRVGGGEDLEAPMGGDPVSARGVFGVLCRSALTYFLWNELAYAIMRRTSAVTYSVANVVKRVAVMCAAIFVLNEPLNATTAAGMFIVILGTALYTHARTKFG
uniref:Sugar phosphate transporter domain-containing protein n=1 Tax=Chromera velia CCMP2878 TaxID=1169474 RepID=A0A0G4F3N6_9ALVE|eukprot:Cvel_15077.t1-p1 / transcript=Cvel_15077.t1 / gene=Cvel_15077 / organism=Chromera_velia_CCMP2878 / gene_product=Phosphoenolpyruvate/phosphate translocator 3,, putative / transcript_product=Phosphoenolpyruvate/phosphate translocator 3,, putative / location=Cvel_scaffold1099:46956-48651(+) / protein_length=441 / sequence_SO=supercontig / SO=protein_coding / is_pseudo=false